MTSSIGLNWTQEDGLSMLTLESSTLDPHHHHHYPQSRKQFYYRLFDIDCPFRFTLRSVLGDALDGNFAIFKASVVVEGFTLDSIEDGHFGEVVEMQLKYSDLVPGCSLNLTIEDVEDDDNSAFRVQFDLFESDTGLRQGQFKIPLVLQNPENSTLLHMEKVQVSPSL